MFLPQNIFETFAKPRPMSYLSRRDGQQLINDHIQYFVMKPNKLGGIFFFALLAACAEKDFEYGKNQSVISFDTETYANWINSLQEDKFDTRSSDEKAYSIPMSSSDGQNCQLQVIQQNDFSKETGFPVESETRATEKTSAAVGDAFGITAYAFKGNWANTSPVYFDNLCMTKNTTSCTLPNTFYWPSSEMKMRFYGYYPYGNSALTKTTYTNGNPALYYEVPAHLNNQMDILACSSGDVESSNFISPYPLSFNHILTEVKFAVGDLAGGTITNITIDGVYGAGYYDMENQTWYTSGSTTSFSFNPNYTTSGTTNAIITSNAQENLLMMIPQALSATAKLKVTISLETGGTRLLEASIGGNSLEWRIGNSITYKISSSSINNVLNITRPGSYGQNGGTNCYSVESYKWTDDGIKTAVGWTAKFYDPATNTEIAKPSWVTSFTSSGIGGSPGQTGLAVSVSRNDIGGVATTHINRLKMGDSRVTSGQVFDLSTHDQYGNTIGMTTANCYVIHGPGTYKIPLVYGNGVYNGLPNPSSYSTANRGPRILTTFVDYLDAEIKSPYIYKTYNPSNVCIVWQDENNLILPSSLKLSDLHSITDINGNTVSRYTYITFTINEATIKQGNALIAVRDSQNRIIWSWHIWVTDELIEEGIPIINTYGVTYDVIPVPIGWCSLDDDVTFYSERKVNVRIYQNGTGEVAEFPISQDYSFISSSTYGGAPLYVQGRKDPMLPTNADRTANKSYYNNTYTPALHITHAVTLGETIRTPYATFQESKTQIGSMSYDIWCTTVYDNLWNADNMTYEANDNNIVKTIYDPSPVGYTVSPPNAYVGFTSKEDKTETAYYSRDEINAERFQNGWFYYTTPDKTNTIFFPGTGIRDGGTILFADNGYIWSSGPLDDTRAWLLTYGSTATKPLEGGSSTYCTCRARGIRPVKDKLQPVPSP